MALGRALFWAATVAVPTLIVPGSRVELQAQHLAEQDLAVRGRQIHQARQVREDTVAGEVTEHPECTYFTDAQRTAATRSLGARAHLTEQITRLRVAAMGETNTPPASAAGPAFIPNGGNSSNNAATEPMSNNKIDFYIFQGLNQAGVAAAPPTTDAEFIRRVTLDITGRIPTAARLTQFLNDTSANKRAAYIDELIGSPAYVDKWTMYFGDLYGNSSRTSQFANQQGSRNAFYTWIKTAVTNNTPYNQMATTLISARSADTTLAEGSWTKGELRYLIGGFQNGGGIPPQDTIDQQAANVADTFLGISHANCLLCHNGAGHLSTLSLWGGRQTRYQAWQYASFFSRTVTGQTAGYFNLTNTRNTDYQLNTTTGNRPSRQPSASPSGKDTTVAPLYFFSNPPQAPAKGEDYRVALARMVTNDFQFARATVNYIWAEMMGRGIVDPPDQFDPARVDPYNPPPQPWTMQPSNPMLLQELSQEFINSGYDLQWLIRTIANSQTYQLSSRYNGTWNDSWEPLFARHLARRLTAEEIHDAISQSSNVYTSFTLSGTITPTGGSAIPYSYGPFTYAMQLPETDSTGQGIGNYPDAGFLDDFLRGNRVDTLRSGDSSTLQALDLMNSTFLMNRVVSTTTGSLLAQNMNTATVADNQFVNNAYLAILSRYPTNTEMTTALNNLKSGTRAVQGENLLWVLYNKLDFIFNY